MSHFGEFEYYDPKEVTRRYQIGLFICIFKNIWLCNRECGSSGNHRDDVIEENDYAKRYLFISITSKW